MIIHFERDATYYAQAAAKAQDEGRMYDALRYADKARTLCPSFDHNFAYASLLNDLECYLESSVACMRMRLHPMDGEQLKSWIRLMADNAQEEGAVPAVIHYNQEYLRAAESAEAQELLEEYLARWDEGSSRKLQFSNELHDEDNRTLYRQAVEAFEAGEYSQAVLLAASMQEGYALHKEGLFVRGMSKASLGDVAGARADLLDMYALSHDPRILLHLDEVDSIPDGQLSGLLAQAKLEDKDDYWVAACLASRHHEDEQALELMESAIDLCPFDAFLMLNYAAALYNVDHDEDAQRILREAKELHPFLPTALLTAPPMQHTLVRADMPKQWEDWLTEITRDKIKALGLGVALLDQTTRGSVRYLLCFGADGIVMWLCEAMLADITADTIALARECLLVPKLNPMAVHHLLKLLLLGVRRGKVGVAFHYIYQAYMLKVPASFEDMSDTLKEAFFNAYFEMAFSLKQNETKLARLVEKIYLNPPEWDYDPRVMGTALWTVVCLGKEESRNMGSLLDSRGLDPTQYALAVSYLKQLKNNG